MSETTLDTTDGVEVRAELRVVSRLRSRRRGVRISLVDILMLVFTAFAFLVFFAPIVWMVITGFKAEDEVVTLPIRWLPSHWLVSNYAEVIQESPLLRSYGNSLAVAVVVTVAQVLTSTIGAYAFAKLRFPGRDFLFIILLSTMMIPGFLTQIPLYVIVHLIGWLNTYWALTIPFLCSAFGLFMMRQYMLNLPNELIDAARVDGAGELFIIRRVVLPLTKEAAAALAIFVFLWNWDQLFWPLMVAKVQSLYTVPLALLYMTDEYGSHEQLQMAGAALAIIPPFIIFLLMQDKIVKGVTLTGLKG